MKRSMPIALLTAVLAAALLVFSTGTTAHAAAPDAAPDVAPAAGPAATADAPTADTSPRAGNTAQRDEGPLAPGPETVSTFLCDHWTHVCVKFNKSETRTISRYASPGVVGAAAWAGMLCSKIPSGPIVGACTVIVAVYAYLLARSFDSAAAAGRCVELHFGLNPATAITSFWWKTEGC